MDAGSPPAATTPIRECDCPSWVLNCAHFDGVWIALHHNPHGTGFAVCRGTEPPVALCLNYHADPVARRVYADYDAALHAFDDAEAALLRGGDE